MACAGGCSDAQKALITSLNTNTVTYSSANTTTVKTSNKSTKETVTKTAFVSLGNGMYLVPKNTNLHLVKVTKSK